MSDLHIQQCIIIQLSFYFHIKIFNFLLWWDCDIFTDNLQYCICSILFRKNWYPQVILHNCFIKLFITKTDHTTLLPEFMYLTCYHLLYDLRRTCLYFLGPFYKYNFKGVYSFLTLQYFSFNVPDLDKSRKMFQTYEIYKAGFFFVDIFDCFKFAKTRPVL